MKYQCIAELQQKAGGVAPLCRLLQVSRSGYYAAQRRMREPKTCSITPHLQAAFAQSGRSYGSRRLRVVLDKQGIQVGRDRIRKLMGINNIRSVWKRKFIHSTDSSHALPIVENVLNRQFMPNTANVSWAADITPIPTRRGWLYLAVVMDLFSRKIVGWAMASQMPAELVCSALQMAITQRNPAAGLVVHSDRGSQYASQAHRALLARHAIRASMSRKGNCWEREACPRGITRSWNASSST